MSQAKKKNIFLYVVIIAAIIKIFLFLFAEINFPASKFEPDSTSYLNPAKILASEGVLATRDAAGTLQYEVFRTPGYPVFLAVFHYLVGIPLWGILILQMLLTGLAAFVTYKAAVAIDIKIGFLSAAIILLDLPITIFSLMIMSETLFLLLMAIFAYVFISYLKTKKMSTVVLAAFILVLCTYVRPVTYYLGAATAAFMIYAGIRGNIKKCIVHILVFLLVVYSFQGLWKHRNHMRAGINAFSTVCVPNWVSQGLLHSYAVNKDPVTKGMAPAPYYLSVTSRCFLSLMTRPGSLKYFQSKILTAAGKAFGYPWMVFWMVGLIAGIARIRGNIYYQFILFVALYLMGATVVGVMWSSGERYRVPIMPFIAIISAYGWTGIVSFIKGKILHA